MKVLFLLFLLCLLALQVDAGTITGKVNAEGKAGANSGNPNDVYLSHALRHAERVNYAEMRDFVVYIEGPLSNAPPSASVPVQTVETRRPEVDQKKAEFTPHILPVQVGTKVRWPNNDTIFHNVFSYSPAKKFDLELYKYPDVKDVVFDQPGEVDVFCSIHANMSCVVLVRDNPYFAITDRAGRYCITNVPPGIYTVTAWHERMPPKTTRNVQVSDAAPTQRDFTLTISVSP